MTPKQRNGYWRRWSAACATQGWTRANGYTASDLEILRRREQREALDGVVKSSKDLVTEEEITLVFARFDQLASNGTDLTAAMKSLDPKRHNLIHVIQKLATAPYREKIMRDQFGTTNLDGLSTAELEKLRFTLTKRQWAKRKKTAPQPQPSIEPAEAVTAGVDRPF